MILEKSKLIQRVIVWIWVIGLHIFVERKLGFIGIVIRWIVVNRAVIWVALSISVNLLVDYYVLHYAFANGSRGERKLLMIDVDRDRACVIVCVPPP